MNAARPVQAERERLRLLAEDLRLYHASTGNGAGAAVAEHFRELLQARIDGRPFRPLGRPLNPPPAAPTAT